MDISFYLIFCGMAFVGAIVQGVSGFAFGVVVLMVYPHLFGYTNALALTNLMVLMVVLYNSVLYFKHCNWRWVPLCVGTSAVFDFIGIMVLKNVGDNPIWYTLMGIMFILMAGYLLWGQKKLSFKHDNKSLMIFSAASGAICGAFAVGGPVMATFFIDVCKTKEEYLGTQQIISIFTMGTDVLLRAANGMFVAGSIRFAFLGLVFIVMGLIIAHQLVDRMNALTLRRVVCAVMAFDGLVMLLTH